MGHHWKAEKENSSSLHRYISALELFYSNILDAPKAPLVELPNIYFDELDKLLSTELA